MPEHTRHQKDTPAPVNLSLSDALWIGIAEFPVQSYFEFFNIDDITGEPCACAMGCIIWGLDQGETYSKEELMQIGSVEEHPIAIVDRYLQQYLPPHKRHCAGQIKTIIVHMNDELKKSREDIAEWLRLRGM